MITTRSLDTLHKLEFILETHLVAKKSVARVAWRWQCVNFMWCKYWLRCLISSMLSFIMHGVYQVPLMTLITVKLSLSMTIFPIPWSKAVQMTLSRASLYLQHRRRGRMCTIEKCKIYFTIPNNKSYARCSVLFDWPVHINYVAVSWRKSPRRSPKSCKRRIGR